MKKKSSKEIKKRLVSQIEDMIHEQEYDYRDFTWNLAEEVLNLRTIKELK